MIGLQSTGEARTAEALDEYGDINDFVSTAKYARTHRRLRLWLTM